MGGGGGNTGGSTTATTQMHPIVEPAYGGAVDATKLIQRELPIWQFMKFNPALTASIQPMQQEAMKAAIYSTQTPSGLSALFDMANPINMISSNMMNLAQPNNALSQVYQRLGYNPMQPPTPMTTGQQLANAMPALPSGELFPGMGRINPGQATQGGNMITTIPPVEGMQVSNPFGRRDMMEQQIRGDLYSR